jgi:YihY family inner membrane protein
MSVADRRRQRVVEVVVATYEDYRDNRSIRLGAGLAYYGILALAPVLTLAMWLAAFVFDEADVEAYLSELIIDVIGDDFTSAADAIVDNLSSAVDSFEIGIVGIGTLIFASSLVFVAVEDAISSIWGLPVQHGMRTVVTKRLRSFVVVLGAAALVIAGLVAQSVIGLVNSVIPDSLQLANTSLVVATAVVAVAALAAALSALYYELGPDELRRRPALIGGSVAAAAMTLGSVVMTAYFSRAGNTASWSIAAGPFVGLLWIYYQAQILLAGAHFVRVLDRGATPDRQFTVTNRSADLLRERATVPLPITAGEWTLDPAHSVVEFAVRHLGISTVRGRFGGVTATLSVADDLSSSSLTAEIDMSTVDTGNSDRDAHLLGTDFFDANTQPTMSFRSTAIADAGDGAYRVSGDMTINAHTQRETLDARLFGIETFPMDGSTRAGFEASGRIDRTAYGIDFNVLLASGGVMLSNGIDITIDAQLVGPSDD